jgi:uncharacterized protein YndB with AHSA1/START domain
MVKKWWGPKMFYSPTVQIDFREGGKYLSCMRSDQGPEMFQKGLWSTGVYQEIVELEKIVSTDSFADENGNVVPGTHYGMSEDFPLEMQVTVTFEDYDQGKTRMILKHKGMPAGADSEGANQGWNESFDKLATSLSQ